MSEYERVQPRSNTADIVRMYYKRFGVERSEGNEEFIVRLRNSLLYFFTHEVGYGWIQQELELKLANALGIRHEVPNYRVDYEESFLWRSVEGLKPSDSLARVAIIIHLLLESVCEVEVYNKGNEDLYAEKDFSAVLAEFIAEAIAESNVNIALYYGPAGYELFPATEVLFDDVYVRDVLNWMMDYPDACTQYKTALQKILDHGSARDVIDNLRLSLELFFKGFLGNEKSLEKQIPEIGKYLQGKNVSKEIGNMYQKLLDYYCNYNNNHTKHGIDAEEQEVDYMVYLTGSFIRFLIQLSRI